MNRDFLERALNYGMNLTLAVAGVNIRWLMR